MYEVCATKYHHELYMMCLYVYIMYMYHGLYMILIQTYILVNISSDSGKVELVFEKKLPDDQWSSIGQLLDKHNKYVPDKDFSEWQLPSPCFSQLSSLLLFIDLLPNFETRIFS